MRLTSLSTFLLASILTLCSFGCQSGSIQASAVSGTFNRVSDRHDKYVNADTTLSPVEKSVALRDTALLRAVIQQATPATQPTK